MPRSTGQSELLNQLVHRSPIGQALVDLEGAFTTVNAALCTILGYERDELIGMPVTALAPTNADHDLIVQANALAAGEIDTYVADTYCQRKDGSIGRVRLFWSTAFDAEGERASYGLQVEDIGEIEKGQTHRAQVRERISTALAEADLNLQGLLNRIGDLMLSDFADLVSIGIVDEDSESLLQAVLRHRDPEVDARLAPLIDTVVHRGEGLAGRVWETAEPLVLRDVDSDEFRKLVVPPARPFFSTYELRSMLIVPLRDKHRIVGTITVARSLPSENFDQDDVWLLREIADTCAMAIANTQLYEQSQAQQEQYRLLATNAADIVLLLKDFKIAWASPSVTRFGWQPEDMIGSATLEYAHPDDVAPILEARKNPTVGSVVRLRFRFRHRDGNYTWVESQTAVSQEAETLQAETGRMVVSIRDIDEQMRADLEVQDSRDQLAERNASLTDLNRKLARSNRDLEQFARISSHDLKSPIRQATVMIDLAMLEIAEGDIDEAKDVLSQAGQALASLHTLIDDLLAFARQGPTNGSSVDLDAINRVHGNLSAVIQAVGATVSVEAEEPTRVPLPPTQLQQVLRNLVDNSLKYRQVDVPPEIHVTFDVVGDEWRCRVIDNGIGIDEARREKVFDLFYREGMSSGVDGTGLGLALCRKIIERAGGHIGIVDVESKVGTCVEIRLPIPDEGTA